MEINYYQLISTLSALVTTFVSIFVFIQRNRIKKMEYALASTRLLIAHPVFGVLKELRRVVTYEFKLKTDNRTNVFRDLLVHKLDIWGELLTKLTKKVDYVCRKDCYGNNCHMDVNDLYDLNREILEFGMDRHTRYFHNDTSYTPEEKEMLGFAMDHFISYHSPNVLMLKNSIEAILTNARYTKCSKTLQSSILTSYQTAFNTMLHNVEESLVKINGFFDDKTFHKRKYSPIPSWVREEII